MKTINDRLGSQLTSLNKFQYRFPIRVEQYHLMNLIQTSNEKRTILGDFVQHEKQKDTSILTDS
jgi:hypothetical protein